MNIDEEKQAKHTQNSVREAFTKKSIERLE